MVAADKSTPRLAETLTAGDTWQIAWILPAADDYFPDLTGATARLHVRDARGVLVLACDTTNGRLAITPAARRIDLNVPFADMEIARGVYEFDLEVTWPGAGPRRTIGAGTLTLDKDISHG
jgi:hypothetical protein